MAEESRSRKLILSYFRYTLCPQIVDEKGMSKYHNGMRPQDVVVLVKLALSERAWSAKGLADSLGLSKSEVCDSLERSRLAGLLDDSKRLVKRQRLVELLKFGVGYVFPATLNEGQLKGLPTALSAKPLADSIQTDLVFVWPDDAGESSGVGVSPLYKMVPFAASQDEQLHGTLALIDTLRMEGSRIRERNLAKDLLDEVILNRYVLPAPQ